MHVKSPIIALPVKTSSIPTNPKAIQGRILTVARLLKICGYVFFFVKTIRDKIVLRTLYIDHGGQDLFSVISRSEVTGENPAD